jgi:long-subunit fatty acid transport protein
MNRRNIFDSYTVRAGIYPSGSVPYRDSEERSGVLTCWSAGLSTQVSPQAFVGVEGHGFTGDLNEIDKWAAWGICDDAEFSSKADLGGYGASIGMQYQPLPIIGIGAVLTTPQRITLKGGGDQPVWDSDAQDCVNQRFSIDDSATLPYSMGVGVSVAPSRFLINLDMVYTDWHELKYLGRVRDPNSGDYLYKPTTDLRAGVEYAVGLFPLRLRAGYARIPLEFQWFDVTRDRSSFSLGAGTVVESALGFDFAWERTSFERESLGDQYSETRTIDRLILTLAYRF